jgi:hypothetical protein
VPDRSSGDANLATRGGTATSTTSGSTTSTTTAPSTTAVPGTSPTSVIPPQDATAQDCGAEGAPDGLVSSGLLPDGRSWRYQVEGRLPQVDGRVLVDGAPVTDGTLGADQQQEALPDDRLVWGNVIAVGGGEIADFVVPASAVRVDVYLAGGGPRQTVDLCATGVPTIDGLRYAALFTQAGAEVVAAVALDAEGTAVAHTDFVWIPDGGGPETMTEVSSGDLPNGPWSLRVGGGGGLVAVQLDLPSAVNEAGGGAAVRSRPELLRDTWYASSVWDGSAGHYFVWGFTREDVAEVVVTMYDTSTGPGEVVHIPTLAPAGTDAEGRVFAGEIPVGLGVRALEGHTAGGTKVVELREPENGAIGNGMSEQANARIPMRELG